jgi:hypothetical protein
MLEDVGAMASSEKPAAAFSKHPAKAKGKAVQGSIGSFMKKATTDVPLP